MKKDTLINGSESSVKAASLEPFPHVVIDDFLPEDIINPLLGAWDKISNYLTYKANKGKRLAVLFGTKSYEKLLSENLEFSNLHSHLISSEFLSKVNKMFCDTYADFELVKEYRDISEVNLTLKKSEFFISENIFKKAFVKIIYNPLIRGLNIRRFIRKIGNFLMGPYIYPVMSLSLSTGGYVEPAHADSRHKIFIGLIYLDDMDGEGELFLYRGKNADLSIFDSPMYPANDDLEVVKTINPKKNRLVLFLNTNNAWHGTGSFSGDRRFIYFSFAAGGVESAFYSKFSQRLGDRTKSENEINPIS